MILWTCTFCSLFHFSQWHLQIKGFFNLRWVCCVVVLEMDLTWLSAILVGAGYLALGYFIGSKYPPRFLFSRKLTKHPNDNNTNKNNNTKSKTKEPLEIEQLADILDDFKMVIIKFPFFIFFILPTHKPNLNGLLKKLFFFPLLFCWLCSLFFLQVLVVRNDLKMGKGKIAAQCR